MANILRGDSLDLRGIGVLTSRHGRSGAEQIPHSRSPLVTGSSTNHDLAQRLGLSMPSYQGVTGVVGVLHPTLEASDIPSVSLRVGIPHYLSNASHPLAVRSLQSHLSHVLGVGPGRDLSNDVNQARMLHDELVATDPQLAMYVTMLEREFDRRAESIIPSADDLGAELEEFRATSITTTNRPQSNTNANPR